MLKKKKRMIKIKWKSIMNCLVSLKDLIHQNLLKKKHNKQKKHHQYSLNLEIH